MPVSSYLVAPDDGRRADVALALGRIPGCDVVPAENRDLLLLVTDTPDLSAEAELRASIEAIEGVRGLVMTFGEIDPDTTEADPLARDRKKGKGLPMVSNGSPSVRNNSPDPS